MAFIHDDLLDLALAGLANNGNRMCLCSQSPTTFTEADTTYNLAKQTLTTGDGNGVYTIGDGDTSGRKVNVAQQTGIPVTSTGTWTHVAIVDTVNEKLLLVTALSASVGLTTGNTATANTFDAEFADAA